MPITFLDALGLVGMSVVFIGLAYLLALHYVGVLRRSTKQVVSTDVLVVLLFGAWSAPATLAALLFYVGVVCGATGLYAVVVSLASF